MDPFTEALSLYHAFVRYDLPDWMPHALYLTLLSFTDASLPGFHYPISRQNFALS